MNKQFPDYSSQKQLNFKDYMQFIRSRSKPREESISKTNRSPPPLNKTSAFQQSSQTVELVQLQKRFIQIEEKYSQLLQTVKMRNLEQHRMRQEIQMYKTMHQRDTEQIEKLRCIIGLINRKTVQTQVSEEDLEWNHPFRYSRSNKFDQSTEDDIKLKITSEAFHSKDKTTAVSPKKKQIKGLQKTISESNFQGKQQASKAFERQGSKGLLNQYQRQLQKAGGVQKKLSNSPYSQLRFVPGSSKR